MIHTAWSQTGDPVDTEVLLRWLAEGHQLVAVETTYGPVQLNVGAELRRERRRLLRRLEKAQEGRPHLALCICPQCRKAFVLARELRRLDEQLARTGFQDNK